MDLVGGAAFTKPIPAQSQAIRSVALPTRGNSGSPAESSSWNAEGICCPRNRTLERHLAKCLQHRKPVLQAVREMLLKLGLGRQRGILRRQCQRRGWKVWSRTREALALSEWASEWRARAEWRPRLSEARSAFSRSESGRGERKRGDCAVAGQGLGLRRATLPATPRKRKIAWANTCRITRPKASESQSPGPRPLRNPARMPRSAANAAGRDSSSYSGEAESDGRETFVARGRCHS